MGKRGPTPRHQTRTIGAPSLIRRPPPPDGLAPAQADLWQAIVATEPEDLFGSEALCHLLRLYVEHAAFRDATQILIARASPELLLDPEGAAGLERLLRARDRETKVLVSLATRLRLTNQSRYTPQAAASATLSQIEAAHGVTGDPAEEYF